MTLDPQNPAVIRAELARSGRRGYEVAAEIGLHPSHLSRHLHAEKFPESLGRRILAVLAAGTHRGRTSKGSAARAM